MVKKRSKLIEDLDRHLLVWGITKPFPTGARLGCRYHLLQENNLAVEYIWISAPRHLKDVESNNSAPYVF